MTNQTDLSGLRYKKRLLEEELEANKQAYLRLKTYEEKLSTLEKEGQQFYDELYDYYWGTSLQSDLAAIRDGISHEQEAHRKELVTQLELLKEQETVLIEKQENLIQLEKEVT